MADSPEAIKKAQKLYIFIGLCLFAGTVATVLVAVVPAFDRGAHGFDTFDLVLGLAIACTKVALVMYFFMHLGHEKGWVYGLFATGIVGAIALAVLLALAGGDPIKYEDFGTGGNPAAIEVENPS
ncbi:MAG: cytochrome C oxidase subunit IV family protein [Verrucomicrobiota bacterium]